MGNVHRDSELMSERRREEGGWEDGWMALETRGSLSKKESAGRWNRVQTNSEGERLADECKRKRRRQTEMWMWSERWGHRDERIEEERGAGRISLW